MQWSIDAIDQECVYFSQPYFRHLTSNIDGSPEIPDDDNGFFIFTFFFFSGPSSSGNALLKNARSSTMVSWLAVHYEYQERKGDNETRF